MRTLALLSIVLAVVLGLPFEKKEAQEPLPKANQRPLVGDHVPVQGHVVVENPAPQLPPSKVLQVSDSHPEKKGQDQNEYAEVQIESVEKPLIKTDLIGDNSETEPEKNDTPVEEVSLESGFSGSSDKESVRDSLEGEIVETVVEQDEDKPNQELNEEAKYDFEQPIMELEPMSDEEMQEDELLQPYNMDNGVYEEPSMFLEPEDTGDQFMEEQNVPQAVAMEDEGPMLNALGEPFSNEEEIMSLENVEESEMLPPVDQDVNERCYCSGVVLEGKCYQFFTSPRKAADAEYFCQDNFSGGHLAAITNSNIHNEMMNLMRQNGGTRRTWVGGIRFLDTGRFVWLDGSRWVFADWLSGEPNNTADLEDCIEVLASGEFNDFTCWEPQAFICSFPVHC
ncbi:hypothetical protein NL108_007767 [Boleophthalmus pectinirostris]|uniref:proteoglycan 3 n=1 Tax=Boleophthalmus pectinirostris TaxID=150288 RepID=UPI0024311479|nr:proteoglycan 3 [Boleophthalmus pectinirostris]KAJ0070399.1 hypothetical protein NL108_007767 [Boleophthalmus pectinirostris]